MLHGDTRYIYTDSFSDSATIQRSDEDDDVYHMYSSQHHHHHHHHHTSNGSSSTTTATASNSVEQLSDSEVEDVLRLASEYGVVATQHVHRLLHGMVKTMKKTKDGRTGGRDKNNNKGKQIKSSKYSLKYKYNKNTKGGGMGSSSSTYAEDLRRLFDDQMLADVSMVGSDGVHVRCHKFILSARSEVFRAMLSSGMVT